MRDLVTTSRLGWVRTTGRVFFGLVGGLVNSLSTVGTFGGIVTVLLCSDGAEQFSASAVHVGNVAFHACALFALLTMLGDEDAPALVVCAVWAILTAAAAYGYWIWALR